jgi:hypothetical protein
MIKKMLMATAMSLALVTPTFADNFFDQSVGYWRVFGFSGDSETNPSCIASASWDDGSTFLLIQDLADGELLLEMNNNIWNVEGPYGNSHQMTLNMYSGNRVESWQATFTLIDKNTIQIRGLDHEKFLKAFTVYDKMVMIMPGTVENAEVQLKNSRNAVGLMGQCLREVPANLNKPSGGSINGVDS